MALCHAFCVNMISVLSELMLRQLLENKIK